MLKEKNLIRSRRIRISTIQPVDFPKRWSENFYIYETTQQNILVRRSIVWDTGSVVTYKINK
jgi:hypothetical protein